MVEIKIKKWLMLLAIGFGLVSTSGAFAQGQVLNILSSRNFKENAALYQAFTRLTGIEVVVIEGSSTELLSLVTNEQSSNPADLYIASGILELQSFENQELFESLQSIKLEVSLPSNLRHPSGKYFGFSTSSRVILYNKNLIAPVELTRYEDLSHPQWKGLICLRSSSQTSNLTLIASMLEDNDLESMENWMKGVTNNLARKPMGGEIDQIKAVSTGECGITLANTNLIARLMSSKRQENKDYFKPIGFLFPNQDDRGTHINISGAGILKGGHNRQNAKIFLEFLGDDIGQRLFSEINYEYPVVLNVSPLKVLKSLGNYKTDPVNISLLGEKTEMAERVTQKAGW